MTDSIQFKRLSNAILALKLGAKLLDCEEDIYVVEMELKEQLKRWA